MNEEDFEKILRENGKKIRAAMKSIENSNRRFNEKINKILKVL